MSASDRHKNPAETAHPDMDEARLHLLGVREVLAGYAEYAGLTLAELFLPSMSESTRRHASGQVLMQLLEAVDIPSKDGDQPQGSDPLGRFAEAPFLVCTLLHPETGVRVAVLGAAAAGP